jgi:hypothetical protein
VWEDRVYKGQVANMLLLVYKAHRVDKGYRAVLEGAHKAHKVLLEHMLAKVYKAQTAHKVYKEE